MSKTPSRNGSGNRLQSIDLLRFIAALSVVGTHWIAAGRVSVFGGPPTQPWGPNGQAEFPAFLRHAFTFGGLGVQLFFMISGFVICMSSWGRTVGEFALSRISRLFPAYWFAVILTFAVLYFFRRLGYHGAPGILHDELFNLSMLQGFYGVHDTDPVYWTLLIELRFYIMFAVVVAFGVSYRRVVYFAWIWLIAALFARGSNDSLLTYVTMPNYAPYFIAGIAFFLIWKYGPSMILWGLVGLCYLSAQLIEAPDKANYPFWGWAFPQWPMTVCITAFFVALTLVSLHKTTWMRWRGLTVLGSLSYPLYLLHQQIGFTIIAYLHTSLGRWPTLAITAAAVLLLCYLVARFVERPGQRFLKRGITKAIMDIRQADAEDRVSSKPRTKPVIGAPRPNDDAVAQTVEA